ncbi:MAG: hypothetical protein RSB67_03975 [Clostridia bacterium]
MDENANKAILIGVAIFITIAITTGVIYTIGKIKEVYKEVYETDTLLSNRFDEFDQYNNAEKSFIDFINTIKKYADNSEVKVFLGDQTNEIISIANLIPGTVITDEIILNSELKYTTTCELKNGIYEIRFYKKN